MFSIAPREGFVTVVHRACGTTVQMPTGPDFWWPASGGIISARIPCPACGCTLSAGVGDLIIKPEEE